MVDAKSIVRCLCLAGASLLIGLLAPAASSADFEIVPGSVTMQTLDSEGNPDTRAGAHPDRVLINYELAVKGTAIRDLLIEIGPGFTGNPFAAPICPRATFEDDTCPPDTQVGVFTLQFDSPAQLPLYNVARAGNEIASFAFAPAWQTELGATLRQTDFGLSMSTSNMPELPSPKGQVELWGVPADHVGGPERAAFVTTPPQCGGLKITLRARSWEPNAQWVSETGETLPFTECENLSFEPDIGVQLSNPVADSPTGAQIDLNMKTQDDPDGQVSANLKSVTASLPHGTTVSPGGVEGRETCRDDQFGLGTESAVTCPGRSRIGTVEIVTPQLVETLKGPVFLGDEKPGERFRLFVDAVAPGIQIKTLGKLVPDQQTGELSAVLDNLPQVALSRITLKLDESTPLLASPLSCGPATAQAKFVPYGPHQPVDSSSVVDVKARPGSTCPSSLGFSPSMIAGSTLTKAGANTSFSFTLARGDGEQLIEKFSTVLPPGLSADLTDLTLCSESAASAGQCGADSKIGTAIAEVGSGPITALVHGDVYLTGPYRNAPFGLSIVLDATIGPFHLGTLNVRGMLRLDPRSGQHTIETEPLPLIFEGLALRFRTIGVDLDRGKFLRNPTSCDPKQIAAKIYGAGGTASSVDIPFNINECESLGFRPKFSLAVKNGSGRRGKGSPDLALAVKTRDGDANVSHFKVKFPSALSFHSDSIRAICARADAIEGSCPRASQVGTGLAHSTLLDEPLRGPVYLVQPKGSGFPDFWSSLEGMGVRLELVGESVLRNGHLMTEMIGLPDVPLSSFVMNLHGGKAGIFSLDDNACGGSLPARSKATPGTFEGHNGATRKMNVQLKVTCGTSGHQKRNAGRRVQHSGR